MSESDPPRERAARPIRPAAPTPATAEQAGVPVGADVGRPIRAAAPMARPPSLASNASGDSPQIPRGLSLAEPGLSGMPSLQPSRSVTAASAMADRARARSVSLRETALPSCIVLGVTLPLLAAFWFALDRFSVIRDNPLGIALPITLAAVGLAFFAASGLLIAQLRATPVKPAD